MCRILNAAGIWCGTFGMATWRDMGAGGAPGCAERRTGQGWDQWGESVAREQRAARRGERAVQRKWEQTSEQTGTRWAQAGAGKGRAGGRAPCARGDAAAPGPPRPTNSHSLLACAPAPRLCGVCCRDGTSLNEERKKPNTCRRHPYWAGQPGRWRAGCSHGGLLLRWQRLCRTAYCSRHPGTGSASERHAAGEPWGLLAATAGWGSLSLVLRLRCCWACCCLAACGRPGCRRSACFLIST